MGIDKKRVNQKDRPSLDGLSKTDSLEAHESTKDKISQTAAMLFATNGFDATSMRKIAGTANVSLASINYHFKSKQDLYHAILVNAHTTMNRDVSSAIKTAKDFFESVDALYGFCIKNADMIRNIHAMMTKTSVLSEQSLADIQKVFTAPPGFKELYLKTLPLLPENTPFDIKFWLINNVTHYVLNWIIWSNEDSLIGKINCALNIEQDCIAKMIRLHCEALVSYASSLKSAPTLFDVDMSVVEKMIGGKNE